MKRVLITGSLGYLGSVLTQYLADHGFDCIGYDTGFFKNSLLYPPPKAKTVYRDARNLTEADLDNVDVVVHLAGISNDPIGKLKASLIYDPTREYSLKIAKMCKKLGVRFIFASSCSIYGVGGGDLLSETSPAQPQTLYSLNKLQIEEDLHSISDKNFSPIALRFSTVFGPSPRIRFDVVINMFVGMAVANKTIVLNSDGLSWRPNLHIMDACQAIRRAIEFDYCAGELLILNVGDDQNNLQVLELAKIVQSAVSGAELKFLKENPALDKEGFIRDRKIKEGEDTRTYKVSFEKINKTLPNFKCEWSVNRGVEDMAALFERISFNKAIFKRRGFYRLQELEYLHGNKYLSDDLYWLREKQEDHIPQLSEQEINEGLLQASSLTRRRHLKILHRPGDEFNEAVNFMMQDSYMQPHLHPGDEKIEKIYLIRGKIAVLFFDGKGFVKECVILEKNGAEAVEVPAFSWHTYVMLSESAITYETMMGVYESNTWKKFAEWAPSESSPESGAYLDFLKSKCIR